MKNLIMVALLTLPLSGCFYKVVKGTVHCDAKNGFPFPSLEYDTEGPETSRVIDLVLGPQSVTFRDKISGEMMTVGKELVNYYECKMVTEP